MKTKSIYKTGLFAALPIGCVAGLGLLTAQAQEEGPEYTGSLGLGVGGAIGVDGNSAALQQRLRQNGNFYGGISDFGLESEMGDTLYTIDGSAMFGNGDHSFIFNAQKEDTGYLELGYREFRTWYDGSGGYLPGTSSDWLPAFNEELHIDRGEIWLESGLRMEDFPELTFRYSHSWRDGQKDSTAWDGNDSGRYIIPAYFDIDEQRDTFELGLTHTLGNTDLGLGLIYEMIDNDNLRVEHEEDAPGSTAVSDTVRDVYEADLFNAYASSVTRLNDQMIMSFGYSFTTMDTDTDGSARAGGHQNLIGGANYKAHIANANFWWNPIEDLVVVPSIRVKWEDYGVFADFVDGGDDVRVTRDSDYELFSEQLETRYTGIENLVLYAKVLMTQETGDTKHYEDGTGLTGTTSRFLDSDTDTWKTSIGGTWYARKNLSLAAEYYHKSLESDYDADMDYNGSNVHLRDYQIDEHDVTVDDINLRLTWRARSNLTLVTRYDWQSVTYDAVGVDGPSGGPFVLKPEIESGDSERNILSQSVTYLPTESLYLTGFVSYTWADTQSASGRGEPDIIARSDNDYLTASLNAGYALDERTTLTAGYSYYYAENYIIPDGTNVTAYGTDMEEHVFSLGLNRQIRDNVLLNAGYAYYASNDGDSGGNNDFDAHILSTGLQVSF